MKKHVMVAPTPAAKRRLRLGVASVVLASVVAAGCSGDDDKPSAAPSTITTTLAEEASSTASSDPTTVTTVVGILDENQAIVAAYRSFWDAYIAAANHLCPVEQRYANGETAKWSGKPGSDKPAPVVSIT